VGVPYRARVNERTPLNLPGFHRGAYVYVYVEDTSERDLLHDPFCEPGCTCCPQNFEPRLTFEIADCRDVVELQFDVDSVEACVNSLHKLDTLAAALGAFRAVLEQEFEPYRARERQLDALRE